MSGGHFDYKQYCIGDIADSIVTEIARAMQPLPPPTIRKGVISKVKTGKKVSPMTDYIGTTLRALPK
jgi:hypothetical protein